MAKLRNFDWRQEAKCLMDIQDKGEWKHQKASSFSDWLKSRAETEGIKISLLWRYLRVGRFAVELKTGSWIKVKSPSQVPEGINADALELLEKISRVATADDFTRLAQEVYEKTIKRPQLLKTWQIYRQALPAGQTARGRGISRPVLDEKDPNKQRLAFEQNLLRTLAKTDPLALGYDSGLTLRLFPSLGERQKRHGYAAILLVFNEQTVIDVAFVVFAPSRAGHPIPPLSLENQRLWLITPDDTNSADAEPRLQPSYPKTWGVIQVQGAVLQVMQTILPNPLPLPLPVGELLLDLI